MTALGTGLLSAPSTTPVTTPEPPCGAAAATLGPPIKLPHSANIVPANNTLFIGFSFLRAPRPFTEVAFRLQPQNAAVPAPA
jgi:hypothetical protein